MFDTNAILCAAAVDDKIISDHEFRNELSAKFLDVNLNDEQREMVSKAGFVLVDKLSILSHFYPEKDLNTLTEKEREKAFDKFQGCSWKDGCLYFSRGGGSNLYVDYDSPTIIKPLSIALDTWNRVDQKMTDGCKSVAFHSVETFFQAFKFAHIARQSELRIIQLNNDPEDCKAMGFFADKSVEQIVQEVKAKAVRFVAAKNAQETIILSCEKAIRALYCMTAGHTAKSCAYYVQMCDEDRASWETKAEDALTFCMSAKVRGKMFGKTGALLEELAKTTETGSASLVEALQFKDAYCNGGRNVIVSAEEGLDAKAVNRFKKSFDRAKTLHPFHGWESLSSEFRFIERTISEARETTNIDEVRDSVRAKFCELVTSGVSKDTADSFFDKQDRNTRVQSLVDGINNLIKCTGPATKKARAEEAGAAGAK